MGISTWSPGERPRERLLANGASTLTDAELVAILLRISDHARRPLPEANAPSAVAEARTEVVKLR